MNPIKQAIEALLYIRDCSYIDDNGSTALMKIYDPEHVDAALAALRSMPAEPVGRFTEDGTLTGGVEWIPYSGPQLKTGDLLYTTPPPAPVPERSKPTDQQWTPSEVDMLKASKQEPLVLNTTRREQEESSAVQMPVAVNRAFLERTLSAMEGVIDVADRKTDEFDALRTCVVDLTLMLHATPHPAPLSDAEIHLLERKHLRVSDVDGYSIHGGQEFARAIEQAIGRASRGAK